MPINLDKGASISLAKEAPGITNATVGLGWKPRATDGQKFDLDASVFALGANGKVGSDADFIFYKQLSGAGGAVVHQGDNTTGEGEGDDEKVKVDLAKVPEAVTRLVFAVTIHEGAKKGQNFGQVEGAFIRVVNDAGEVEIAKYDLSEDASTETAMIFGELYRHDGGWKFKAVGQGYKDGLAALAGSFGINIG